MRHFAYSAAVLALLVGTATARAQEPPPAPAGQAPAPPPIVPPRLLVEGPVTYPEGATGEAWVVLHVLVLENGTVGETTVIEGVEPFAGAAIDAARRSTFEPARRADKPIRAKIKVATHFLPPTTIPAPEAKPAEAQPAGAAPKPPASAAGPDGDLEEVVILGRRGDPKTPTEHRMGRAEMQVVPGAFGDPFRAIDVLPGLVPIISGLPYFYIRGAPPSAVGYYIDEVRVPYLFHFALGPGVIQPALIEEVAVHPAAFPGRFGRFAGGIVSGTTRDPAKELYGEAQIRIYDAGAYVEAPFANGKGTAGVGGRYSYTAGIISLVAPDLTIDYRDYNARVSYELPDRWRATAFTFGGFDYASNTDRGREEVFFASEFHRLDLRLDRRGTDGSTSRVAAMIGLDRTRLEDARFAQNLMTGVRGRHRWPASRTVEVELGADLLVEFYRGDVPSQYAVSQQDYAQAVALFSPRTETSTGVWTSATLRPMRGWDITGTMRGDVFTSEGKALVGPSPRLSTRVPLTQKIAFLGALGVAPQPPAFAIPVPAVGYHGLPGGLAYAYQKSAGVEFQLPAKFTFKTVGFHHTYLNLRDFANDRTDLNFDEPQIVPKAPVQGYGVELLLMRKLSERYSAYGSATFSRAQLGSSPTEPSRVSPFDRSYVLQVGGVADLGAHWRTSARFLTYGGWPDADNPGTGRLPGFYRVDLRIEKKWMIREHRYIALVLEGMNVTAHKEIVSRNCFNGVCRNEEIGPLAIPNFGVEGAL